MENQEQKSNIDKPVVMPSLFFTELSKWLQEKGFVNDRGWKQKSEGMGFYSFVKGKFRVEIKTDWNIKYDWYGAIYVQIIDCEKEFYGNGGYIGWVGQNVLQSFKKPFSRSMFDELCEYHGL